MPKLTIQRSAPVESSFRVDAVRGRFDLPHRKSIDRVWTIDLPTETREWQIGLITGPSGAGKSTIARDAFPDFYIHQGFTWPSDAAMVDGFPRGVETEEIFAALSSVGLSSPPDWLKRFSHLSNGQRFRCELARLMCEERDQVIFDEFTAVVDRTVARIGSAALAKALRKRGRPRLIAVTCHGDVTDWLDPDWVYDVGADQFDWRLLRRRPPISLEIHRCRRDAWRLFKDHHYLSAELSKNAICFAALVEGRPAAFTAAKWYPHPAGSGWREHRTVRLPDFQGVGIGNALSECVASLFAASGHEYRSVTGHPGMIAHRMRSPMWHCTRRVGMVSAAIHTGLPRRAKTGEPAKSSYGRATAAFRYVGPAMDPSCAAAMAGLDLDGAAADRLLAAVRVHGPLETSVAAKLARLDHGAAFRLLKKLADAGKLTPRASRSRRMVWLPIQPTPSLSS